MRRVLGAALFLALSCAPAGKALGADPPPVRGFVDGTPFVDILGDDAITVEISLSGALLKALTGFDPELKQLAGGLESIHALVLTPQGGDQSTKLLDLVRSTEGQLKRKGWQAVATVRERANSVKVMVLNDDDKIDGLVVMVVDTDGSDPEVVFVNIAGKIDLAALAALGEGLDLPGLDELGNLDLSGEH